MCNTKVLNSEGRLPVSTLIVDASKARFQREFIAAVQESGGEVILDTKCAEEPRGDAPPPIVRRREKVIKSGLRPL